MAAKGSDSYLGAVASGNAQLDSVSLGHTYPQASSPKSLGGLEVWTPLPGGLETES